MKTFTKKIHLPGGARGEEGDRRQCRWIAIGTHMPYVQKLSSIFFPCLPAAETSNLGENLFAPENGYFYFFGHRFHTRRAWGLVFIYDTTNYTSNHYAFIPTLQTLRIRPQGGVFFFVNLGGVFFL